MQNRIIGNIKIINTDLTIHTTPLEEIVLLENKVNVYFDDENENRWCFTAAPFQATK